MGSSFSCERCASLHRRGQHIEGDRPEWGEQFCYMGHQNPGRSVGPAQEALDSMRLNQYERERLSKLVEIASRGFSLGALLELQCLLLDPHACEDIRGLLTSVSQHSQIEMSEFPDLSWYDPATSTTKEVAYRALVPLTRKIKSSMSKIMTGGQRCFPKCLISHTWSNVFTHTIAACVADAMGESCYFHLIPRLQTFDEVCKLIHELGHEKLTMTYWICALSINQHTVACGSCEPVEWKCNCGVVKVTSGPQSEIGAFDIMMRVLTACDSEFYQVVATDKEAIVVERVWVMAEFAEGIQQDLRQIILPHFPLSLSSSSMRQKMKGFSVETCQVTVLADTIFVLSRIPDKPRVNKMLRNALTKTQDDPFLKCSSILFVVVLVLQWNALIRVYGIYPIDQLVKLLPKFITWFELNCIGLQVLLNIYWSARYRNVFRLLDRAKGLGLYREVAAEITEYLQPRRAPWDSVLWHTSFGAYLIVDGAFQHRKRCIPRCRTSVAARLNQLFSFAIYSVVWTGIHIAFLESLSESTDMVLSISGFSVAKLLWVALCLFLWVPLLFNCFRTPRWIPCFFAGHLGIWYYGISRCIQQNLPSLLDGNCVLANIHPILLLVIVLKPVVVGLLSVVPEVCYRSRVEYCSRTAVRCSCRRVLIALGIVGMVFIAVSIALTIFVIGPAERAFSSTKLSIKSMSISLCGGEQVTTLKNVKVISKLKYKGSRFSPTVHSSNMKMRSLEAVMGEYRSPEISISNDDAYVTQTTDVQVINNLALNDWMLRLSSQENVSLSLRSDNVSISVWGIKLNSLTIKYELKCTFTESTYCNSRFCPCGRTGVQAMGMRCIPHVPTESQRSSQMILT